MSVDLLHALLAAVFGTVWLLVWVILTRTYVDRRVNEAARQQEPVNEGRGPPNQTAARRISSKTLHTVSSAE